MNRKTATRSFKWVPFVLATSSVALLSGCATAQYDSITHPKFSNSQSINPVSKVNVDAGGVISTVTYANSQTGTWVRFNNDCKITHLNFINGAVSAYRDFDSGEFLPVFGTVTIKSKKYHIVNFNMSVLEFANNVPYWVSKQRNFLVNENGDISSKTLIGVAPGINSARSDCSITLLKNYTHTTTNKVSVYYMGRTNSGFIKIGVKRPKDFQDHSQSSINIPAEPGVYSISSALPGYKVKVYGTSRFRATLQLEKGATVE